MPFINSPNMGLPIPTISNEPGPQFATDINQCLSVIDSHTHLPGNGLPIGSQSINLQGDLPFNINNATSLRSARFVSTTASSGTDIGCVYVRGIDLFYNDTSGNIIRLTQSGGLASTGIFNGNISTTAIISATAPTPATSGFVRMNNNTDFVSWRNATNNADNEVFFDSSDNFKILGNVGGGVETYGVRFLDKSSGKVVYETAANSSSAYTLTLPAQPTSSVAPMFLNPSGTITTTQQLTRAQLPTLGQQVSASSTFVTVSASLVPVSFLTAQITTTGRPVCLNLLDGSVAAGSQVSITGSQGNLAYFRNATQITSSAFLANGGSGSIFLPPSCFNYIDVPASSSYTYSVQVSVGGGSTLTLGLVKLLAYEL